MFPLVFRAAPFSVAAPCVRVLSSGRTPPGPCLLRLSPAFSVATAVKALIQRLGRPLLSHWLASAVRSVARGFWRFSSLHSFSCWCGCRILRLCYNFLCHSCLLNPPIVLAATLIAAPLRPPHVTGCGHCTFAALPLRVIHARSDCYVVFLSRHSTFTFRAGYCFNTCPSARRVSPMVLVCPCGPRAPGLALRFVGCRFSFACRISWCHWFHWVNACVPPLSSPAAPELLASRVRPF